jgi:predicted ATPase/DNA-binding NarL/FixJ family response regulator
LSVLGEVSWPVPALSVLDSLDSRERDADGDVQISEAMQLFVERAKAVRPDFTLTRENTPIVANLCKRLDGLPLAIELAAARTRAVPVRALVNMLGSASGGLPILTGGPRGAPERQRTLRATISWSYDLLPMDEQALFRRLGVFRGAGLEAIRSVCIAAIDGPGATSIALPPLQLDVLDGVSSLLSKSLLRLEGDDQSEPRYVMLETVREFALERLEASGEGPAVRRRHALHFLRFVEEIEPRLYHADRMRLVSRLEREHANWRSALDWCAEQGYAEPSLRLAIGLATYWLLTGHVAEGRSRLAQLLTRFPLRSATGSRALLHAWAQHAAGRFATLQGELTVGRHLLDQAFAIMHSHAHSQGMSTVLESLAFVANQQADFDAARAYLEQRVALGHALEDPWMITNSLYTLGCLALEQGQLANARAQLEEAVTRFEQLGDPRLDPQVGYMYIALAQVEEEVGQHERAQLIGERALSLMQRGDDPLGVADALATLGGAAAAQRKFAAAYDYLASSLRILQQDGDILGIASVLNRFALLSAAQNEHARALRLMGAASVLLERAGMPLPESARSKLEAKLASAKHALGPMADTAVAAGRALPPTSAIADALATGTQALAGAGVDALYPLSAREIEVGALISLGKTNRQIATELVITEGTVANHVAHILAKLGLRSRAQIAVWATAHGLPPPRDEPE